MTPPDNLPGTDDAPGTEAPGTDSTVHDAVHDDALHDAAAQDATAPGAAAPDAAVQDAARALPTSTPSRRRTVILLSIAAAIVVLDIVTKIIVVATIQPGENVRALGGLVYLTQIRNAGAAFSMATGITWLLAIIALAVVAFIIRMAPKLQSTQWAVCLGLILGGAVGNLIDRIFRAPGVMQGHVVDFVSVFAPNAEVFPAFNAADSGISIGGVLLVLLAVLGYDYDGTRHRKGAGAGAAKGSDGDATRG